jgi:hypothetical protein
MRYIGALEEWTKQGQINSETRGVKSAENSEKNNSQHADMSMALVQ